MSVRIPGVKLAVSVVTYVLISWMLIHFLALFGLLLAAAYPILWFFFPKKTYCFYCRSRGNGTWCPLCKSNVTKTVTTAPKHLRSALLNSLVLLLFSAFSLLLVFGESRLLLSLGVTKPEKTVSFYIPPKGQHRLGEIFPLKVELHGIKTAINSVQVDIGFDPEKIEVVDILTEDSFANIFIQKDIDNTHGWARLTGGLPNPGYNRQDGVFSTILLKGKSPGLAKIDYLPTSMVLANDSSTTNVLNEYPSIAYLILPERISNEEEELQKGLTFNSNVLGESDSVQLTFYEETSVLSTQTSENEKESPKETVSAQTLFFDLLSRIDSFILDVHKWMIFQ